MLIEEGYHAVAPKLKLSIISLRLSPLRSHDFEKLGDRNREVSLGNKVLYTYGSRQNINQRPLHNSVGEKLRHTLCKYGTCTKHRPAAMTP